MKSPVAKFHSLLLASALLGLTPQTFGQPTTVLSSTLVTLTMRGYELPRAEAAELLSHLPAAANAKELLFLAGGIVSQGRGKIVKLPTLSMNSGGSDKGYDGPLLSEAQATLNVDGSSAVIFFSMNSGPRQIHSVLVAPVKGVALVGTFDESSTGNVTLIFMRTTTE